jgi:hypothetical protein
MCQRIASNQSNTSLFSYLLVFLVLLNCFTRLCCFKEKSNRFSLTRQGPTLFHVSHQVFVQTRTFISGELQEDYGVCEFYCEDPYIEVEGRFH